MMISTFPSPVAIFRVGCIVQKGVLSGLTLPGFQVAFTTPITLKLDDRIWLDVRNGTLYTVERGGIAIWRKDWVN